MPGLSTRVALARVALWVLPDCGPSTRQQPAASPTTVPEPISTSIPTSIPTPTSTSPAPVTTATRPAPTTTRPVAPATTTGATVDPALAAAGDAGQVVVVTADRYGATTATLTAYERQGDGWRRVFGPWTARVGTRGVAPPGEKRERDARTPSGVYGFDFFFGVAADPGVSFPLPARDEPVDRVGRRSRQSPLQHLGGPGPAGGRR